MRTGYCFEDQDEDGRINMRCILKKINGRTWNEFLWPGTPGTAWGRSEVGNDDRITYTTGNFLTS